ncbi:DUF982 domain-containing protein [Rhizobium redzepovicii]|uniref:DUF982 domain-containing protein n=1 Tax=Rhizobium redzepovicii TaxID=2867518 RepID=UPI002872A42D|nr:DUF982 domain-containing protein [Rhizobium redzepovicii]MDR9781393.1 DUF982 domain-containing protein [Rhizobium redzepovicii]
MGSGDHLKVSLERWRGIPADPHSEGARPIGRSLKGRAATLLLSSFPCRRIAPSNSDTIRTHTGTEIGLPQLFLVNSPSGATAISDHSAFWKKTISIDLDAGERLVLRSPQDALYALVSDWPIHDGVHQQRAIDFCRAWLAGRMPAETVRQAFILAALEAGVPIADDENGAASSVSNPPV